MPDDVAVLEQQQDAGSTAADSATVTPEAPQQQRSQPNYEKAFRDWDNAFPTLADPKPAESSSEKPAAEKAGQQPAAKSEPAQAATAQAGASTEGEVANAEAEAETETAADGKQDKAKPGRVERVHLEYKPIIESKDQEITALKEQLAQATGTLSAEAQRDQATREQFLDAYGPDDEYERLTIANNKGLALTPEQYDSLQRWTTTRELARPFQSVADARAQSAIAEARETVTRAGMQFADYLRNQLDTRTQKYGLDPDTVQAAEYGGLIDHAVSVTERRKDAEYTPKLQERDDKISQLDAQLREVQDTIKGFRPELLRGGHPSEVVPGTTRTYSERNIKTPLADDWGAAFR